MVDLLQNLDRRWIFLLMFLAVALPVVFPLQLPQKPTPPVETVFDTVAALPAGSRIWVAMDFDPASSPELMPMVKALTRHAAERGCRLYYMTLWPTGSQLIDETVQLLRTEFPELQYGRDYVNLGFRSGAEAVVKSVVYDLRTQFAQDKYNVPIRRYPMFRDVKNLRDMDLVVSISAGTPGIKEWVQYAATPYPEEIPLVGGVTAVSAPMLFPYVQSGQLRGLLAGIKGAAEYEWLLAETFGDLAAREPDPDRAARYQSYTQRTIGMQPGLVFMGSLLAGHVLIIGLIVLGNVVYFLQRRQGGTR